MKNSKATSQKNNEKKMEDNFGHYKLEELTLDMCHFETSENAQKPADFRFCGKPVSHKAYCSEHASIVFYKKKKNTEKI